MAAALAKRNVIADASVVTANDQILEVMGEGLGCPGALVPVMLGGK
jgi:hypothetical protein